MQQALPTLPSLGSATVSRCVHYSCRPSCPPPPDSDPAASDATSVHVSYAPATWWKHQPSAAPPPSNHFKSATDLHVEVLTLCTFSIATPANNRNTWERKKNTLKTRFYQHRSNINKNTGTLVTKHFNQTDHSIHNMKCVVVETVHSEKRDDRLRERGLLDPGTQDPGSVWLEHTRLT